MEYHAKNVGIRRAKSDWIIATNADVAIGLDTIGDKIDIEFYDLTLVLTARKNMIAGGMEEKRDRHNRLHEPAKDLSHTPCTERAIF